MFEKPYTRYTIAKVFDQIVFLHNMVALPDKFKYYFVVSVKTVSIQPVFRSSRHIYPVF